MSDNKDNNEDHNDAEISTVPPHADSEVKTTQPPDLRFTLKRITDLPESDRKKQGVKGQCIIEFRSATDDMIYMGSVDLQTFVQHLNAATARILRRGDVDTLMVDVTLTKQLADDFEDEDFE